MGRNKNAFGSLWIDTGNNIPSIPFPTVPSRSYKRLFGNLAAKLFKLGDDVIPCLYVSR